MNKLSADARYFGSSMFWLMSPNAGKLTFHMVESKPSPRSQAALDELVAAKLVKVESFNELDGVAYTTMVQFSRPGKAPSGKWPVTIPIRPSTQEGNQ